MHWLFIRPAIGWGAFALVHAIAIPLVYAMGKAFCNSRPQCDHTQYLPVSEPQESMDQDNLQ